MLAQIQKTNLVLLLDGGIVDGKQSVKPKTYSRIKPLATDENVHAVGTVIGSLQKMDILEVQRVDYTKLSNE